MSEHTYQSVEALLSDMLGYYANREEDEEQDNSDLKDVVEVAEFYSSALRNLYNSLKD